MNLSDYKITITPTGLSGTAATTYTSKVYEHLLWIYRTTTGRILFNSIKFHGLPIIISPYTKGDCNATGGWVTVAGKRQGFVNYSPNTFSLHGACPATKTNPNRGLLWDEILFHELIHAFRGVSGKWNQVPLNMGLHRYTDTEEFNAVMITNIYISDRSNKIKTGLRKDHKGFNPLSGDFDEPFEFFSAGQQVFELVDKFCKDNPGFSKRVAVDVADAPFNPLADYYVDSDRAKRLSQGAAKRDVLGLIEQMMGINLGV